ncbi:MAG: fimbrial protein [Comamonas sp.]
MDTAQQAFDSRWERGAKPEAVQTYGKASYADLGVTTFPLTGSSQITGLGCEVNAGSLSIDVRLPTIAKTDFDSSPIPRANDKAKTFSINLLCDSGVKVSYQVDGTQTSAGNNVLANSIGKRCGCHSFQGRSEQHHVTAAGRETPQQHDIFRQHTCQDSTDSTLCSYCCKPFCNGLGLRFSHGILHPVLRVIFLSEPCGEYLHQVRKIITNSHSKTTCDLLAGVCCAAGAVSHLSELDAW